MTRWNAAQELEAKTWREGITASPVQIIDELTDAIRVERLIRHHGLEYRHAVDVGIGPLGVGWIGLFGVGGQEDLIGLDPLERIEPHSGHRELDTFLTSLQSRIVYVRSRAEDARLPSASFDLVVCDNVVDHAEEPAAVLRECARLITRDGAMVFGVNVFSLLGHQKWLRYTRVRDASAPNVVMHPHSYTAGSARRLLEANEWRVVADYPGLRTQRLSSHSYRYYAVARRAR